MFGLGNKSKVRGNGYVMLNILRGLNIISLLAMASSNMVLAVKGAMMGAFTGFGFFALVSGLLTSLFATFLVISEADIGKIKGFFSNYFPVFSTTHSLGWLGMAMIFLGVDLLGNLNSAEYTANNLGLPFWRLCLASAILCLVFGALNLLSTLVFREHDSPVTDRLIRSDGSLAEVREAEKFANYDAYSTDRGSSHQEEEKREKRKTFSRWFGNSNNKGESSVRTFNISGPIHVQHDVDVEGQTVVAGEDVEKEDRSSPVLPYMQRPPTAMHPANRSTGSRYSVVSHMTRF